MTDNDPYTPDKSRREEILEDLRRVGREQGKRITGDKYDQSGEYSQNMVRDYLGSFNEGVREAGLFPSAKTSENDLVRAIKELADRLDRTPSRIDMEREGVYSGELFTKTFESWPEALRAAGFSDSEINEAKMDIPREELLRDLQRLANELGRSPEKEDINEKGSYDYFTYWRRFGGLPAALRKAGIDTEDS